MKICYKCKKNKDLSEFSKDSSTNCGLNAKCKECQKLYSMQYEEINKDLIREKKRLYYLKNKNRISARNKNWKEKNPGYANSYSKSRSSKDPIFKLKGSLRQRLCKAINGSYKGGSAVAYLGCDIVFLKNYLESKFKMGMDWRNHGKGPGKWNIDHIIPLSYFDLTKEEEIAKACNYKNLQPLWSDENISKGNRL